MSTVIKSQRSKDEKVVLTWENLSFITLVKDLEKSRPFNSAYKSKKILDNLQGRAESGELLAILGPSGCG